MLKLLSLLLIGLCSSVIYADAPLKNQLAHHPSPYLALHGEDPVAWQDWGPDVMARARDQGKLVFISSGYFACHWCHVMQRESYQNKAIAELLNGRFIPVKIDRELLPALDAHLIGFVQRTRGHAGWPLNVFLTPEGYPLLGLTYSPPQPFEALLNRIDGVWLEKQLQLRETARLASLELLESDDSAKLSEGRVLIDPELLHVNLITMALVMGNELEGGFGNGSRFPMVPQWMALLERQAIQPDEKIAGLLELTLDSMAGQGLQDHLAGGFFRYTVDPGWQIPHYEKMLYNQALLSRLYLKAAGILNRPDYLQVARNTLDFTLNTLAGSEGGFIASLSAIDHKEVEGGGYLWGEQQLRELLSDEEYLFAKSRWRLDSSAQTEGGYLPIDAQPLDTLVSILNRPHSELIVLEQTVRKKLLMDRVQREHPRDSKQLAAWNGLLLSALVEAAQVLDEPRYRQAATALKDFLVNKLWSGQVLLRARGTGGALGSAALEDYAYVAVGLNDWNEYSAASASDHSRVRALITQAWRRFYRKDGWVNSDDQLIPGLQAERAMSDGPMPSPSALLIELTLNKGSEVEKAAALNALRQGYPETSANPIAYATYTRLLINTATGE